MLRWTDGMDVTISPMLGCRMHLISLATIKRAYQICEMTESETKKRNLRDPSIITNSPNGFFNGASNKNQQTCGARGMWTWTEFECGLGKGTHNYTEIKEATILMTTAPEEAIN